MNLKQASSLSRVWQFIQDPNKTFGIVSAYRNDHVIMSDSNPSEEDILKNKKQNKIVSEKKHKELKEKIRDMGLGYVELIGGTQEKTPDGKEIDVIEDSLFIPNIAKDDLMELGKQYNQDSVIYKNKNTFAIILTKGSAFGKEDMNFTHGAGNKNMTFNEELIKSINAFSAIKKGPDAKEKFLFQPPPDPIEELMEKAKEEKTSSSKVSIKMSKSEWIEIGEKSGWLKVAQPKDEEDKNEDDGDEDKKDNEDEDDTDASEAFYDQREERRKNFQKDHW
jgi:hypothetical protein